MNGMHDDMFADMPPLVDANTNMPRPNIPPPAGAKFMANYPPPQNAFAGQGWNAPMPPQSYPQFQPAGQDEWARWVQYCQAQGAPPPLPQQSMPSPYVPRLPMNPQYDHFRKRSNSAPPAGPFNTPFNVPQQGTPWNMWGARPPIQTFPSTSSYISTSAVSMTQSLSATYMPPDWPGERPKSWRRGFKFKSGISSLLFRRKSVSRLLDASTDSARLKPASVLREENIIFDLRCSQPVIMIRTLGRPAVTNDLMLPSTNPPTLFMRLYHTRLPWYIDIRPMGNGSYVTLSDLLMGICQFLAGPIRNEDYYNDELDAEDREELKRAWVERCKNKKERMEGVKRVDFLREKYMFLGLTRGKRGMWELCTGKEFSEQ